MHVGKRLLRAMTVVAAVAALTVPGAAFAQGGPPEGHGHGVGRGGGVGGGRGNGGGGGPGNGGGGPGEETAANNLSVPAIFVGGTGSFGVTCGTGEPGGLLLPSGTPLTGYTVSPTDYYYIQGLHTWQAQCETADAATATAAWGDNLAGGEAALKVGSPIRVEVGLLAEEAAGYDMTGFTVVKLEPSELDRVSPYGTLATGSPETGFTGTPVPSYPEVRVWDAGATLKIYNTATPNSPVFDGPATAEINATGRVVYGYNLRVPTAGDYTIEFYAPTVTISSVNAGSVSTDGHTISLTITVNAGGGGGKGPQQ